MYTYIYICIYMYIPLSNTAVERPLAPGAVWSRPAGGDEESGNESEPFAFYYPPPTG